MGDYEGPSPALRGFYLQDLVGDNDSGTSDAVFVFNGNNNNVQLGQVVRVTGTVSSISEPDAGERDQYSAVRRRKRGAGGW